MENGVRVALMGSRDARPTERGSFFPQNLALTHKTSYMYFSSPSTAYHHTLPTLSATAAAAAAPPSSHSLHHS